MTGQVTGMARRVRSVHMVGVGGSGMSGIAEVLVNLGYEVQGSDLRTTEVTRRLGARGVRVREGHRPHYVDGAEVVVVSSAVAPDNVEVLEARRRKIPVIQRAEMLAELMRLKLGVAVAGAHGKTTTTSMVGAILAHAGLEPTVVVGGKLNAVGSNAQLGSGACLVVEADESDGSFVHLSPTVSVVTNLDTEHLDHYSGGMEEIRRAFRSFLARLPFYGVAIVCVDDPEVQALSSNLDRRVVTYGFSPQAELRAEAIHFDGDRIAFEVVGPEGSRGEHRLSMVGAHNVQNALAALAVAEELGVSASVARAGLESFAGVDRRFTVRGEAGGVLVVDDYGHHPSEISATLRGALRSYPKRRVVAVFQPHRFSRTASLLNQFGGAFHDAEAVFVLPVYGAGEAPIEGADHSALVDAMTRAGHPRVRPLAGLPSAASELASELRSGDLVITFGAGSIGELGPELLRILGGAR